MGETGRKLCPCLQTLWEKCFRKSGDSSGKVADDSDSQTKSSKNSPKTSARCATHSHSGTSQASQDSGIYRARWSFEARADDELSFDAGDMFRVVNRTGDWWTARKIDRSGRTVATGIVPFNYIVCEEADGADS